MRRPTRCYDDSVSAGGFLEEVTELREHGTLGSVFQLRHSEVRIPSHCLGDLLSKVTSNSS